MSGTADVSGITDNVDVVLTRPKDTDTADGDKADDKEQPA